MRAFRIDGDGKILVLVSSEDIEDTIAFPQTTSAADHFIYVANFLDELERVTRR